MSTTATTHRPIVTLPETPYVTDGATCNGVFTTHEDLSIRASHWHYNEAFGLTGGEQERLSVVLHVREHVSVSVKTFHSQDKEIIALAFDGPSDDAHVHVNREQAQALIAALQAAVAELA